MPKRNAWISIWPAASLSVLPILRLTPIAILAITLTGTAQDLTRADILLSNQASARDQQAARMLQEEVAKRTQRTWLLARSRSPAPAHIILAERGQTGELLDQLHLAPFTPPPKRLPESFSIRLLNGGSTVLIVGADERGVLFGAGYLLRHLDMSPGKVNAHALADIDSAPAYPIRGHQLGYRPKNNTFDGWTADQFEQYIRDLAVFGTNTIEIIPPRSDDDTISPLFTEPPMRMMVKLSAMIDRYGLDCSIWYPALDKDYSNPATVDAAVREWGGVFDRLSRIDAVFVPGGDPGHTEPKYLFALLEKEAARLRIKHPSAQMWVSPQSFSAAWLDQFYALLAQHPSWLTGVVYGPEMRDSPEEFRRKVPASFPIRFYPDITHTLSAQYPVPLWDPAFALTEGREPINPRPADESILFHGYTPISNGFVAYSEGSNDDVNKILWSAWGWSPATPAGAILEEYGRYFIAPDVAPQIAKAAYGLEENWRGSLLKNASVEPTLELLKQIESKESFQAKSNWRLQQLLYRGYYDAYLRDRLKRETAAQATAVLLLQQKPLLTVTALDAAEQALPKAAACSDDAKCRRVQQLADDLFRSIRMQLSVGKYKALAIGRGANLDQIDNPLTSSVWLRSQIGRAKAAASPEERASIMHSALDAIGEAPADLYDDLGDPARQPHLVPIETFEQDPSGLKRTYTGTETSTRTENLPLPWRTFAGTLYDRPLELQFQALPPSSFNVHIDLLVDARKLTVKANGMQLLPICDESSRCLHPTYFMQRALLPDRRLRLSLSIQSGLGGNGRLLEVSAVRLTPAP